jgi:hypothetical protein
MTTFNPRRCLDCAAGIAPALATNGIRLAVVAVSESAIGAGTKNKILDTAPRSDLKGNSSTALQHALPS